MGHEELPPRDLTALSRQHQSINRCHVVRVFHLWDGTAHLESCKCVSNLRCQYCNGNPTILDKSLSLQVVRDRDLASRDTSTSTPAILDIHRERKRRRTIYEICSCIAASVPSTVMGLNEITFTLCVHWFLHSVATYPAQFVPPKTR